MCVARLSPEKGQLLLIEAVARLVAEGIAVHLTLIGDGAMRPALELRVRHHSIADQVSFKGWQSSEAIRTALLDSRAMVLPSLAEGLPVVLMESLALGRPVISTYIAGIPELVRPGENGWLVPAGNLEALCDALREALQTSPARLAEMGRRGAELVAERHNAASQGIRLASLFGSEPPKVVVSTGSPSPSEARLALTLKQ